MRKCFIHDLFQHLDPILSSHLSLLGLLTLLSLDLRLDLSPIDDYIAAEFLAIGYEILSG